MSRRESPDPTLDRRPRGPSIVSVCVNCRMLPAGEGVAVTSEGPGVGAVLLEALTPLLQAQAPDVLLRPVQCLGVCKRPATVAVSAPDGYTFVFGDLDAENGAAAIASFVGSYRTWDYGFVPWRERPQILRRSLVARIPSLAWSPDDGRPPA